MPRNYNEHEKKSRHVRHGSGSPTTSPKRHKRSRSRERAVHSDRRRSPNLPTISSNDTHRKERNINHNPSSYNNSNKLQDGRWGRTSSGSEGEDRENIMLEQRKRKSRSNDHSDRDKKYSRTINELEYNNPSGNVAREGHEKSAPDVNAKDKEGPSMALSGKLMEDTNVFNGVTVKYSEPQEAKKPKRRWRFYVFKGEEAMPVLHLHRQSAYLMGKDRKVADIPIDHPSCSRQHAVLQYRCIPGNSVDGQKITRVLPYIIDLESSNGTFLNNKKIEPKRYMELREKDVLKFGFSSREYVLLHDQSDYGEENSD
jgi:smad nuclear-interacting protein 1